VVVGEGMLELSRAHGECWRLGTGGDTLNTAIHLARQGVTVAYATALGSDAFSESLRDAWAAEGVDTSLVLSDPARGPGLYAISLDAAGERSFTYWRGESAARALFTHPDVAAVAEAARASALLHFSLISLAVLPPDGRRALLDLAQATRAAGGRVSFDSNYRARLWPDTNAAREAQGAGIRCADIGLPTLDDERALSGRSSAEEVARHWSSLGCDEVAVKLGAGGCLLTDGERLAPGEQLSPVDTSGAGDAFDAGYLAARLAGRPPDEAAAAGHRLAAWTIMRPGAIPPRDADYPSLSG
jgi:2-dehydro-3-deoxygluconokinase